MSSLSTELEFETPRQSSPAEPRLRSSWPERRRRRSTRTALLACVAVAGAPTLLAEYAEAARPENIRAPQDCWSGGWTPEICCSSPGAQGNPLCWDHVYSYEKCCTDTVEGQRFHHRRLKFVEQMVGRGAEVHFDIKAIEGTGRSGAVGRKQVERYEVSDRCGAEARASLMSATRASLTSREIYNRRRHAARTARRRP